MRTTDLDQGKMWLCGDDFLGKSTEDSYSVREIVVLASVGSSSRAEDDVSMLDF